MEEYKAILRARIEALKNNKSPLAVNKRNTLMRLLAELEKE